MRFKFTLNPVSIFSPRRVVVALRNDEVSRVLQDDGVYLLAVDLDGWIHTILFGVVHPSGGNGVLLLFFHGPFLHDRNPKHERAE